jgi:class 3 adenylate cyclase
MALFSNPEDAVQSGVVMLKKLETYNEGRKRAGYTPIRIGVGVNTGPVILGMLGEENRLDGTVISDTVNLASRLEGLTKTYCTPLLVSGFTVNALEDASTFHTRHVGQATVKGKSRPVTVYEVLDAEPDTVAAEKMGTATRFEEALLQYEKGRLQEALEGFQECVREVPEDETAKVYAQRCTQRLSGEAAPPS